MGVTVFCSLKLPCIFVHCPLYYQRCRNNWGGGGGHSYGKEWLSESAGKIFEWPHPLLISHTHYLITKNAFLLLFSPINFSAMS